MMFEHIDRKQCKREAAELLREAQVPPKAMADLVPGGRRLPGHFYLHPGLFAERRPVGGLRIVLHGHPPG